ncbi:hypothetical protein OH76DRAFT_1084817 [Lentinus brumalis]|uniref:Uncharacterized protein n=1 Tax=Lentinus brumalis TaxID=2498619 RepID=A0A371DP66_9APHY|nr:hypothetical protein OH76DRAFT_1084817 [Polyporus brumalis]
MPFAVKARYTGMCLSIQRTDGRRRGRSDCRTPKTLFRPLVLCRPSKVLRLSTFNAAHPRVRRPTKTTFDGVLVSRFHGCGLSSSDRSPSVVQESAELPLMQYENISATESDGARALRTGSAVLRAPVVTISHLNPNSSAISVSCTPSCQWQRNRAIDPHGRLGAASIDRQSPIADNLEVF